MFGEGNLLENMMHHIDTSSRTAAGLQQFGSRDYATARRLIDYAYAKDAAANPEKGGKLRSRANLLESEYKVATGRVGMTGNPHVARFFQGVRSILAAAHLGTAPISALTDSSNGMMSANAWNANVAGWLKNEARGLTSLEFRQFARSQGFGVEQISHMMSRWGEDMIGHGIPSFLANSVFRVSGLNALDGARRSGLGVNLPTTILYDSQGKEVWRMAGGMDWTSDTARELIAEHHFLRFQVPAATHTACRSALRERVTLLLLQLEQGFLLGLFHPSRVGIRLIRRLVRQRIGL